MHFKVHTLRVTSASTLIVYGTMTEDLAEQCAITIPSSLGSEKVTRSRHDMLQINHALEQDELV